MKMAPSRTGKSTDMYKQIDTLDPWQSPFI